MCLSYYATRGKRFILNTANNSFGNKNVKNQYDIPLINGLFDRILFLDCNNFMHKEVSTFKTPP